MRQLTLDEVIDRYEAALSQSPWNAVDVRPYLPSTNNSEYWPVLVELLRVRMEHAFVDDASQGVEQCVREFPGLLQNSQLLAELAYEEFRLRQQAGQSVTAAQYQDRWDIDTSSWKRLSSSAPLDTPSSQGHSAGPGKRSVCDIALSAGELFGPFRCLCLLGRGALAKVYLAQQLDLSERAVVLKVCSQATLEPQKIALLQHPHIVQIFSVHEIAGYQVLCMPYAGATTLADLLASQRPAPIEGSNASSPATRTSQQFVTTLSNRQREIQTLVDQSCLQSAPTVQLNHGLTWPEHWQNMRYEHIICELMFQLAQGLAHAHHHGIVHSDLKPANVLIGDDGQARLVDFNVAQHEGDSRRSLMGGTLPYMAPEHILSLRNDRWEAGPASDLYSLGVIAFQLLSGKLPFTSPKDASAQALDTCLADRQSQRYAHSLTSQHASADMRSIIDKLLEPELHRRYASANQLAEDLRRHSQHLPLRYAANRSIKQRLTKWCTRHPRLSSASSVISLSAAVMLLMATSLIHYRVQYRTAQAQQLLTRFQTELPPTLVLASNYKEYGDLEATTAKSTDALLNTLLEPDHQTPQAAVHYLSTDDKMLLAANLREIDKTLRLSRDQQQPASAQFVALASRAGMLADYLHHDELLDTLIESSVRDDFRDLTLATRAYSSGDMKRAVELLTALVERSPGYHAAWLLLGTCHLRAGNNELADAAYSTSLSLMPNHWQAWYYRAQVLQGSAEQTRRQDQIQSAESYYSRALALRPDLTAAIFNRALCRESLGKLDAALADARELIQQSKELVRAHLLAARILRKQGQQQAAEQHTQSALASPATCGRDYVYLGTAQLNTDRKAAAQNFRKAWELQPGDPDALQSLAYLSMELNAGLEASRWLDLWVSAAPNRALPLASRAVYFARQGKLDEAYADSQSALRLNPTPRERVQIASALVLLSDKTDNVETRKSYVTQAMSLLIGSLQSQWQLVSEVARDPDMKSLHSDQRFQILTKTVAAFGQLSKLIETPAPNPN